MKSMLILRCAAKDSTLLMSPLSESQTFEVGSIGVIGNIDILGAKDVPDDLLLPVNVAYIGQVTGLNGTTYLACDGHGKVELSESELLNNLMGGASLAYLECVERVLHLFAALPPAPLTMELGEIGKQSRITAPGESLSPSGDLEAALAKESAQKAADDAKGPPSAPPTKEQVIAAGYAPDVADKIVAEEKAKHEKHKKKKD